MPQADSVWAARWGRETAAGSFHSRCWRQSSLGADGQGNGVSHRRARQRWLRLALASGPCSFLAPVASQAEGSGLCQRRTLPHRGGCGARTQGEIVGTPRSLRPAGSVCSGKEGVFRPLLQASGKERSMGRGRWGPSLGRMEDEKWRDAWCFLEFGLINAAVFLFFFIRSMTLKTHI